MAQKDTDLQKIRELIEIMERNGLVEVEIKHGDDKILLKRPQPHVIADSGQRTTDSKEIAESEKLNAISATGIRYTPNAENLVEIKSPLVGTFYATPSPDSEPCVEVGSVVEPQTVVCIIEEIGRAHV